MTRLVLILSLATWSCGHATSPGVRNGSVGDDNDPTLARLAVSVHAQQVSDRPLEILIYLAIPDATRDACFTATGSFRVTVDGHPTTMTAPGGKAPPIHASGQGWQVADCAPATFSWRADAGFVPTEASRIVVEHEGRRAEVTIAHLTTPRALRILPSDHVRPGDRVTIEWTPGTDEWPNRRIGAYLHIYAPNESLAPSAVGNAQRIDRTWINFGGGLEGEVEGAPPHFRFTMPTVRPGPVHLGLKFRLAEFFDAHPQILSCTGIARCLATVRNGPGDVVMTVL